MRAHTLGQLEGARKTHQLYVRFIENRVARQQEIQIQTMPANGINP